MKNFNPIKLSAIIIAAVVVLATIGSSIAIVPTGYTGVKTTFGQVNPNPVAPGFTFKIPFIQSMEKVNNKQQDLTVDGQIWSETSERATIFYENVIVTYQISSEKSAWLVANVSNYQTDIINSAVVSSAIKTASKELNNIDATNRGKIEPLTQTKLQAILDSKYGENTIFINKVIISNTDFEDSYNDAIAAKQNAQLEYERAAIVNQQAIEKAEADAKVKEKAAEGEANALKIRANAEAEANKKISDSLTDKVLANKFYDSWDGKLPTVMGDSSAILPAEIFGKTN
ncbi:MAG: hypothetical protein MJ173_03400 [Clostridia bacterium]|nr:hypothetical protein [Clostridia bacterium]